jgi:Holliday junction DNA helicase RuvA
MIGKLRGVVDSSDSNAMVLDVNGVGYNVFCSAKTLQKLPANGEAVTLVIETQVREDYIHLYGFETLQEREWFRLLITVKGIGAKVAMALLSVLRVDQLSAALASQDKAALAQANGVSTRLAERILVELKNKHIAPSFEASSPGQTATVLPESGLLADTVSALTNLGYGRSEAYGSVTKMLQLYPDAGLSELIRLSLKSMTQ